MLLLVGRQQGRLHVKVLLKHFQKVNFGDPTEHGVKSAKKFRPVKDKLKVVVELFYFFGNLHYHQLVFSVVFIQFTSPKLLQVRSRSAEGVLTKNSFEICGAVFSQHVPFALAPVQQRHSTEEVAAKFVC